ncbi:Ras GTPase domain-containing protein [Tieghemostelium lacteum]|uniref:Ras GTPase domain-containing protein n=1 Tax=Tieghemostelium lacteum TaxID=361077 RepID=A0A152A179_TIELA|nr:Ras GTPase domain-containing protein [Tieghemostelium lacteum]|eukprot:KYQ99834.1 Ras GTPase domain-containing protein [Tieghemostelium lacteum]
MLKLLNSIENLLSPKKNQSLLNRENSNKSIQYESSSITTNCNIDNQNIVNNNNNNNNVEYNLKSQHLPQDHVLKILVVGGCQVGKTSILRRYHQECFTNQYIPTVGVDQTSMMIEQYRMANHHHHHHHKYSRFIVDFIDVSYAEIRGRHIRSLFEDVSAVVMVFDSVNANSILSMDDWKLLLNKYQNETKKVIPIGLFANKSDTGDPIITESELDLYCKNCGYSLWRFTSAKKDIGVSDGIDQLITLALENKQKEIDAKKAAKILLHNQKQQQQIQIQQRSQKKKERLISQSLPNQSFCSNMATSKQDLSTAESEKLKEVNRINEILESTNEHYNTIQRDLDDLMSKSNGKRYNDLVKLERQRNNEYVNLCNSLKKLIQPNYPHSKNNRLNKEVLYSTLQENIKKWTTLIQNLQLEQQLKLNNSSTSSLKTISTVTTTTITTTTTTLLGDTALSPTTLTSSSSPKSQKSNKRTSSTSTHAQPIDLYKSKMGFGFKNNAKAVSMATSLFNPSNNYNNIDTDNPITASSITTSSSTMTLSSSLNSTNSTSTSTNASPSHSPPHSLSTSPSILPSSYNLNTTSLPIVTSSSVCSSLNTIDEYVN